MKTKTKVTPLFSRILIRQSEAEEMSPGGILIPDNVKNKPKEGQVLAVGSGKIMPDGSSRKMTVKVGDTVLFTAYAATEVKVEGVTLLIVDEDDVLAIR